MTAPVAIFTTAAATTTKTTPTHNNNSCNNKYNTYPSSSNLTFFSLQFNVLVYNPLMLPVPLVLWIPRDEDLADIPLAVLDVNGNAVTSQVRRLYCGLDFNPVLTSDPADKCGCAECQADKRNCKIRTSDQCKMISVLL